jgi:hypothetical protein
MYQITAKHTRPSVDVEFYSVMGVDYDNVTFRSHWDATYKQTGKLIFLDSQLSLDRLTLTTMMLWDSEAAYNEAMADPIVSRKWNLRREYNTTNGIVLTDRTTETI